MYLNKSLQHFIQLQFQLINMDELNYRKLYNLIISLFFLSSLCCCQQLCDPQDKDTLLQIKKQFGNPSKGFASWDPNTDCCTDWSFNMNPYITINCNDRGRVVDLYFNTVDDVYTRIPGAVGGLTALETLSIIAMPNLHGHIPGSAICRLTNLQLLRIMLTNMSGPIPSCLGQLKNLTYIELMNSGLSGKIPPSLAQLPNLQYINLASNKLYGPIPEFSPQNRRVNMIDLTNNNLSGRIPSSIGLLSNLSWLVLTGNHLSGPLPSSLGTISSLRRLDLSNNILTGSIPESYGSFIDPIILDLHNNRLSGRLPKSFGRLNLLWLDLSNNKLNGDAAFLFGYKKSWNLNLLGINLSNNNFKFDFTKVVLPRTMIVFYSVLNISHNMIYGSLPSHLDKVNDVDVSYNQLCGSIPSGCEHFGAGAFAHNKCLCGPPLSPCT